MFPVFIINKYFKSYYLTASKSSKYWFSNIQKQLFFYRFSLEMIEIYFESNR